jgi:DNA-binding NtrC family response regulator
MGIEKHKVLIVDDELPFLELMKELLEGEGYEALIAESGEQGVEVLKKNSPVSVVITDQKMEGMSGLELLKVVKETYPKTIGILISGSIDENELNKLASTGELFWYSLKPIDLNTVLDKIESGIKQYESNSG